jgi:hypothetical protein
MSEKKVVTFPVVPQQIPVSAPPQSEIIELLEHYLERARSGELQAVAIAAALSNGNTTEAYEVGTGPYAHVLMASLAYLHGHYVRGQIDDADDVTGPA